jgi:hypothetical protein
LVRVGALKIALRGRSARVERSDVIQSGWQETTTPTSVVIMSNCFAGSG